MVLLLSLDRILGANNKDIRSHFVNFSLVYLSSTQNQVWRGLWAAIIRSIWEQRNQVVFRGGIPDADKVFQNAQLWSWLWLKHKTNICVLRLAPESQSLSLHSYLIVESLFAGFGDRQLMKRRSPCVRSQWSPKVCKGQHDRRLIKRRSP